MLMFDYANRLQRHQIIRPFSYVLLRFQSLFFYSFFIFFLLEACGKGYHRTVNPKMQTVEV